MKAITLFLGMALFSVASQSQADCFDNAAAYHQVNPWILRAIAMVETNGCKGNMLRKNSNGSIDVGCSQTNSVHFSELGKFGISPNDLMDSCNSIHVSAWLLRKKINKYGNTWEAVGAYHSETPRYRDAYSAKVQAIISNWSRAGQ